jgi:hypothetical protein
MPIKAGFSDAKNWRWPQSLLVGRSDPQIIEAYNKGWGKENELEPMKETRLLASLTLFRFSDLRNSNPYNVSRS